MQVFIAIELFNDDIHFHVVEKQKDFKTEVAIPLLAEKGKHFS